jgi:hypothetical protein
MHRRCKRCTCSRVGFQPTLRTQSRLSTKRPVIFGSGIFSYMNAEKIHPVRRMKFWILNVILVIPLLVTLGSLADARPRDDVMSSAFRCGVIADGRKWLDCIYGSAQPIRAELNLPPVTQTQAQLVAVPPAGGQITDQSARDTVLSAALHCDTFSADRKWLDCYYAATTAMRAALGLSPGTESDRRGSQLNGTERLAAGGLGAQEGDQFGLLQRPRPSSGVESRLASYAFDHYGIFTVTLANGQVWRQVTGDTTYAHWKGAASGYVVTIRKGALGSYNLLVKGGPGLFKVERVF